MSRLALPGAAACATTGLAAMAGAAAWTLTEYVSHRWVLHGPFGRGPLARIPLGGLHRAHHGDPAETVLAARIGGHVAMVAVGAAAASVLARALPVRVASVAAGAWTLGYATYELSHWAAHHKAPRTAPGVRLRRRHFRHHFGAPRSNLGVTTSWWDDLLGSEAPADPSRIPRRHAPDWLVGEDGRVRAEFAPDFDLVDG